jgi:hypothetical protein
MKIYFIKALSNFLGKTGLLCCIFSSLMVSQAHAGTDPDTLRANDPIAKKGTDPQPEKPTQNKETKHHRSFSQLKTPTVLLTDEASMMPEFTAAYIEKHARVTAAIADARSQAVATFDEIDKRNRYTETLSPSDLVELPIGLKKRMGNKLVTIGVSKAVFTSGYSQLTVFCKIEMPNGKPLFFGADNIKLSHDGGLFGSSDLVLLGDFDVAMAGNTLVTFKGGFDMRTGDVKKLTYATLECGGIKELGVAADVRFSRNMILPLDADYNVIPSDTAYVKGSFSIGPIKDFDDIVTKISLPPFTMTNFRSLGIKVQNAVFDFSDTQNDPSVIFPPNYGNIVASNPQLWQGVFIQSLSVILPKEFRDKDSTKRVEFFAEKLLLDNAGVSGVLGANNIIERGSATGWNFSVEKFELELQTSSLRRAGFEGSIGIPLTKKDTTQSVKKTGLAYQAIMLSNDVYSLKIALKDSLPFDIWRARAVLAKGSVEFTVVNDRFKPKAILTGSLDVNVKNNNTEDTTPNDIKDDKDSDISVKSITFQDLVLQTDAPYIRARIFGYDKTVNASDTNKVAKFPITITKLYLETPAGTTEANIKAAIKVNFMETADNKINASTGFTLKGEVNKEGEDFKYKFKGFLLDSVSVFGDFSKFTVAGKVNIYREDPVMGKGFSGGLSVILKDINAKTAPSNSVAIRALAAFGRTTYRYWYVDIFAQGISIPLAPALYLDGIGGGASYHMRRTSAPSVSTALPNGLEFRPDSTLGLGFRAITTFKVSAKGSKAEVGKGDLTFEMLFNSSENGGGLAKIGLYGGATFMPSAKLKDFLKEPFNLQAHLKDNLKEVTDQLGGEKLEEYLNAIKLGKTNEIANKVKPKSIPEAEGSIKASISIEYDFNARVFDGNFAVIVNVINGTMRGINNDTAGWAKIRATPTLWYVHMGTPSRPLGVRLSLMGLANFESRTYFMVGDSLEGSPAPPANVANILGTSLQSLNYMRDLNALKAGGGFAFGTRFNVDANIPDWGPFYASFNAGVGFDIMVRDYGTAACEQNPNEPIGVNGWRANGQAYAYLQGTLGIQVEFFGTKRISIVSAGAATLLQAKLPNPSWMQGYLGGYYSVLGGLFKGRYSCKVTLGNDCPLVGVPVKQSKLEFITDITPEANAKGVDILAVPQVVFRSSINKEISYFDDNGNETRYLPYLDTFRLYKEVDNTVINGTVKWNEDFTSAFYESTDALPANTKIRAIARVKFKIFLSGVWINIPNSFSAGYTETRSFSFTTGLSPDSIPLSNVVYSYPIVEQQYFHPNESQQGFIQLRQRQTYLLNSNSNVAIVISNENGLIEERPAQYNDAKKEVRYTLPTLSTLQNYTFDLVIKPSDVTTPLDYTANSTVATSNTTDLGDGSTMTEATNTANGLVVRSSANAVGQPHKILSFKFASSKFNTFVDKVNSVNVDEFKIDTFANNALGLSAATVLQEPFEDTELKGGDYTNYKPIIKPEAILTDDYFVNAINPLLYSWMPDEYRLKLSRDTAVLGNPPYKGVELVASTGANTFPYRYALSRYYLLDRDEIRTLVEYYYPPQCTTYTNEVYDPRIGEDVSELITECFDTYPSYLNNVITSNFPTMTPGQYPIRLRYVLPDGTETSNAQFTYQMCETTNGSTLAVNAGEDQNLLSDTTYMNATGTGFWSIVDAPTDFNLSYIEDLNNPQTRVILYSSGSVTLRWNIRNVCQKGFDDVVLTRQLPNTELGADRCLENGNFTAQAYGLGNWSIVAATEGVFISLDSFTTQLNPYHSSFEMPVSRLPHNSYIKLRWTPQNGVADEVRFGRITPVHAGADQVQEGATFTLNASIGNGTWSIANEVADFSIENIEDIHSPTTNVTLNTPTTVMLVWTVDNICQVDMDTVVLKREIPVIDLGLGEDQFSPNDTFHITATGSGTWSLLETEGCVSQVIIGDINSPTTTVTNLPFFVGVILRWTLNDGTGRYDDVILVQYIPDGFAGGSIIGSDSIITTTSPTRGIWKSPDGLVIENPTSKQITIRIPEPNKPMRLIREATFCDTTQKLTEEAIILWLGPNQCYKNNEGIGIAGYDKKQTDSTFTLGAYTDLGAKIGNGSWSVSQADSHFSINNIVDVNNPNSKVNMPINTSVNLVWTMENGCKDTVKLTYGFEDLMIVQDFFSLDNIAYTRDGSSWEIAHLPAGVDTTGNPILLKSLETDYYGETFFSYNVWASKIPLDSSVLFKWTSEDGREFLFNLTRKKNVFFKVKVFFEHLYSPELGRMVRPINYPVYANDTSIVTVLGCRVGSAEANIIRYVFVKNDGTLLLDPYDTINGDKIDIGYNIQAPDKVYFTVGNTWIISNGWFPVRSPTIPVNYGDLINLDFTNGSIQHPDLKPITLPSGQTVYVIAYFEVEP